MKTNKIPMLFKKGSLLFFSVLTLAACSKDDDQIPTPTPTGQLALIIASPGAPELSFLIDGKKTTTKALTFGTTIPYGQVIAGKYDLGFSKKDSTAILAKVAGEVKNGKYYTLIVADKSPKASVIFVEDDLSAPASDKAKIRFANLSPDSTSLDLYVAGKTEAGISKKTFKNVTSFISVDPGAELKLEIKENGKTEVLAVLEKVKIEKGKIYTVWAKGLKGATDTTKLGLDITTNK